MPLTGSTDYAKFTRLLQVKPPRFVCSWSQETSLRPCPLHDHAVMELVYHPTGSGMTGLVDGTSLPYESDAVVLYASGVAHDQTPAEVGADVCVHLDVPAALEKYLPAAAIYPPTGDPYVGEEFWSLSRTPPDIGPGLQAVLDLRVAALLLRLVVSSGRAHEATDPQAVHVQRARRYLRDNFARSPDVAEIARHVGVSPDYLRHTFRQRTHTTLNKELTRIRLERSKELLRHSRLPLKDIAAQCGFQNDRYFCTRFSAVVGLTPGEFRNQPSGPKPPPLPSEIV
jgi:AraC-like DNA-binding protein